MKTNMSSLLDGSAVLIFIHQPKTAGTSLRHLFFQLFGEENCFVIKFPHQDLNQFMELSQEERDRFDCIIGHGLYGLHEYVSRPCFYITLTRDPLDRFISHVYFRKENPEPAMAAEGRGVNDEEYSLAKHVQYYEEAMSEENDMLMLPYSHLYNLHRYESTGGGGKGYWGRQPKMLSIAELKSRLRDQFMLVGHYERLYDFIFMLCHKMGCKLRYTLPKKVSLGRSRVGSLDAEMVSTIRDLTILETQLHDYAMRLFQEEWDKLGVWDKMHAWYYRFLMKVQYFLFRFRLRFKNEFEQAKWWVRRALFSKTSK